MFSQRNFVVYDVEEKKANIFIEAVNGQRFFSANSYKVSPDKKFILTTTSREGIFRYSFTALWHVYDIDAKQAIPLTINGEEGLKFSLVKFSPIDNSMIIVYNNNIYYKRTPTDTEVQITTDGSKDIYNGVPDWVYEEEITLSNSATWFSPDGKKIAFIRFDDTKVPIMSIPKYGRAGDPDYQYPQMLEIHYPKAGTKNPEIKLFYVDLTTAQTQVNLREIPVPEKYRNADLDHIITSVSWANGNDLIAVFTNRVQNRGGITKCSTDATPVCEEIQSLDMANGWIEFFTAPFYNKAGTMMTFIWSNNGYRHVVSLDLNAKQLKMRTAGNFVVTSIISYNHEHDVILFTANTEELSRVQHIYAIKNEDGAEKVCLSCTPASGYYFFTASASADGSVLATAASGPGVPQVHIYTLKVDGNSISLTNHIEFVSNAELMLTLENKKLPMIVYDKIVLENGSESQVKLTLPPNMDEKKKHPMLVDVYGGPDSYSVTERWSINWGTYLASTHGIIYAEIDGRGSGLRGDKNLFEIYLKLGTFEIQDQIETASKLQKRYSYIDETRSAIWGWSYGGFAAGMAISTDTEDVFKCAVSVAPGKHSKTFSKLIQNFFPFSHRLHFLRFNVH
jgi:dipeptidyl-peptidase 4